MLQSNLSQRVALVSRIAPQSINATAVTSPYVGPAVLGRFARIIAIAQTGENSSGDVTVSLIKASDNTGTGAQAVATATALAAADGDNRDVILDFDTTSLDQAKPFLALRITVSASTCLVAGAVLAGDARYEPASQSNAGSVAQVLS